MPRQHGIALLDLLLRGTRVALGVVVAKEQARADLEVGIGLALEDFQRPFGIAPAGFRIGAHLERAALDELLGHARLGRLHHARDNEQGPGAGLEAEAVHRVAVTQTFQNAPGVTAETCNGNLAHRSGRRGVRGSSLWVMENPCRPEIETVFSSSDAPSGG